MGQQGYARGERVRVERLRGAAPGVERGGGSSGPSVPAVLAVASIITVAFMGSVIVTPLYTLYQRKFGFSEITLTLVYAVYVVGNVLALLLFGQISDQAGRKRAACRRWRWRPPARWCSCLRPARCGCSWAGC